MHIAVVCLFGLANMFVAPQQPHWNHQYHPALKQAHQVNKPLAIVLGRGPDGWRQLTRSDALPEASRRLLAEQYVCLYVDVTDAEGKQVADAFEADRFPTLVLSDRSARYQAFRESGPMTDARLVQALESHTGPAARTTAPTAHGATTTETNYCRT